MRLRGRIEIGPFGGTSKSARQHQAFLVTADGDRLQLRRYDGPSMRDAVLEAMAGQEVVADGLRRDRLFIARTLNPSRPQAAVVPSTGPAPERSAGKAKRRP